MKRIEFIGAPGVGKSTLLKAMVKNRSLPSKWISRGEMYRKIHQTISPLKPFSVRRLLVYASIRLHLADINKVKAFGKLLNQSQRQAYKACLKKYSSYAEMIIRGITEKAAFSPLKKMHRMEYCFSLVQELAFLESFKPEKIIVFCESVIHNTPGTTDIEKYREMLNKYPDWYSDITPSAVVHCCLDASENAYRRKKRGANRDKLFLNQAENEESNHLISNSILAAEKKAAVMKVLNIPVLEIDMAESIEDNAAKVDRFINYLAGSKHHKSGTKNLLAK